MDIDPQSIRIDYIEEASLQARNIRLGLLRLDLVHPVISGNKWFKLQENIRFATGHKYASVLTFGGAWSNHLVATAAACAQAGLIVTGVVRGFHGKAVFSDTLEQCAALGMYLHFVSREDYNRKDDPAYLAALRAQFNDPFIIPEGGNNELGIVGARAIAACIPEDVTLVTTAIGTGTTFCGIRQALAEHINLLGFPVMKGGDYLRTDLAAHIPEHNNWQLNSNYHWGGFARHKPELLSFMNDFYARYNIPLDFVYTAKMMQGILDMIEKNEVPEDSHIICIHTGGLQGNNSIKNKLHF
jgi:1-aminocyclopropane-1-carboxylate deaminase